MAEKKWLVLNVIIVLISVINLIISVTLVSNISPGTGNVKEQYVMYIGTNDKNTYKQEIPTDEAKKIVDEICLKHFDGYTIQDAVGSWKDETGKSTHENTIVCYFDYADKNEVYEVADEIVKKLNQNTVLIETDRVKIEYYSGQK